MDNASSGIWGCGSGGCFGHGAVGRVADELPIEGTTTSKIRRLKRWLLHNRMTVDLIYGPWVQRTLKGEIPETIGCTKRAARS